jgi:hypothetical protein
MRNRSRTWQNAAAVARGGEFSVEQGGSSPAGCAQAEDRKVAPTLLHWPLPTFPFQPQLSPD